MFKKYIFICDKQPNCLTAHSLLSTVYNKQHENKDVKHKLWIKDNSINLVTELEINKTIVYQFNNSIENNIIRVKLFKEEALIIPEFNVGDFILINGIISYAIHTTTGKEKLNTYNDKIKNICPINNNGLIRPDCKELFLNYLEEKLGIDVSFLSKGSETSQDIKKYLARFEKIASIRYNKKQNNSKSIMLDNKNYDRKRGEAEFWIKDLFSINIEGKIKNTETVKNIYFNNIGRRKSYGFGALEVNLINGEASE